MAKTETETETDQGGPGTGPATCDPAKVVGYEACQKCHGQEIQTWKQTPHYATYKSLHRNPEAKEIAKKMGIRSIKRGDLCIKCHYTQQESGSRVKAISGISCESCHGAAGDWIALHNDYGGPTMTKASESPEHRGQRRQTSMAHGMRNPANVYLMASSCFRCHSVSEEKLVNVGGHTAGSREFEFVAWSQGIVRHNFLRTDYASNAVSSRGRLRVMYLVGKLADLEYSLRAVAKATERAEYGMTSARRVFDVRRHLAEIQVDLSHPLLTQALDAAYGVKLKSRNRDALNLAADQVSSVAYQLAETADGSDLSSVDDYLPSPAEYKN